MAIWISDKKFTVAMSCKVLKAHPKTLNKF